MVQVLSLHRSRALGAERQHPSLECRACQAHEDQSSTRFDGALQLLAAESLGDLERIAGPLRVLRERRFSTRTRGVFLRCLLPPSTPVATHRGFSIRSMSERTL